MLYFLHIISALLHITCAILPIICAILPTTCFFTTKSFCHFTEESAETEPAWSGAGQEVGLKIWRIVKFEVTEWPAEDYGSFYSGDSYIILNVSLSWVLDFIIIISLTLQLKF